MTERNSILLLWRYGERNQDEYRICHLLPANGLWRNFIYFLQGTLPLV